MAVQFNHTIAGSADPEASARWLAEMLGLPEPHAFGPFWQVDLANGVSLDFITTGDEPYEIQHYAFLISDAEFDEVHARLVAGGHETWADPGRRRPGRINHHDGGRGVYFAGPDGHYYEVITRPYGSGS
jgi:catechol 2,3-dioxygenase-like lactoylglutathione lyase family enzyme